MMSKKFGDFKLRIDSWTGEEHSNINFSFNTKSMQGRKKIQNLTYNDIEDLRKEIGEVVINKLNGKKGK